MTLPAPEAATMELVGLLALPVVAPVALVAGAPGALGAPELAGAEGRGTVPF